MIHYKEFAPFDPSTKTKDTHVNAVPTPKEQDKISELQARIRDLSELLAETQKDFELVCQERNTTLNDWFGVCVERDDLQRDLESVAVALNLASPWNLYAIKIAIAFLRENQRTRQEQVQLRDAVCAALGHKPGLDNEEILKEIQWLKDQAEGPAPHPWDEGTPLVDTVVVSKTGRRGWVVGPVVTHAYLTTVDVRWSGNSMDVAENILELWPEDPSVDDRIIILVDGREHLILPNERISYRYVCRLVGVSDGTVLSIVYKKLDGTGGILARGQTILTTPGLSLTTAQTGNA